MNLTMSIVPSKCNNNNIVGRIVVRGDVNSCSFNIFNTIAIGSSDKSVSVWNWSYEGFSETCYSPLLHHDYSVISVTFSPDGLVLATSSTDGITCIFNVKLGTLIGTLVQSLGGGVRESAISPSPNGLLGTVTDDGYIFLWSLKTLKIQRYWIAHEACLPCLAFSPDSCLLATGDANGCFKLWLVDRAVSHIYTVNTLCARVQKDAHDGGVLSISFSPNHYIDLGSSDYQMCSGGNDNILCLWHISVEGDISKLRGVPLVGITKLMIFEGHRSSITCVRFSPDGEYISSTSLDGTARFWEISKEACVNILSSHKRPVFCCAFSPRNGFFASGSNDKNVNVWHLSKSVVPVLSPPEHQSEEIINEQHLNSLRFTIRGFLSREGNVNSLDFNNDYTLAVGRSNKLVSMFYVEYDGMRELPFGVVNLDYSVASVKFSKCGKFLVTCSVDGTIILWNYLDGKLNLQSRQQGRVACFSPASDFLAAGTNDGKIYLWSTNSKSVFFWYPGHVESIFSLAFSPDGELIATGCAAGQLKLWKASPACSTCQLTVENVHDLGITSCDFSVKIDKRSPTSPVYRLATGGNDSLIKVFKLWPTDDLNVQSKKLFCLRGHGGNITQVCFSGKSADLLASTSIDHTTRLWNMENGQCLKVLGFQKRQVTCCAFSSDSTLLASGSLDSTVLVYEIPEVLMLPNNREHDGQRDNLHLNSEESIDLGALSLDDVHVSMDDLLMALKRRTPDIPDHMVCPITQQIMTEPVICEDGFTYESHAIHSWLVNGRNSSPMTNSLLSSTTILVPNTKLKVEIKEFLLDHYNSLN